MEGTPIQFGPKPDPYIADKINRRKRYWEIKTLPLSTW